MLVIYTTKPPPEPLRPPPFYVQDGPLWRPTHTTWPAYPAAHRPNAVLLPWALVAAEVERRDALAGRGLFEMGEVTDPVGYIVAPPYHPTPTVDRYADAVACEIRVWGQLVVHPLLWPASRVRVGKNRVYRGKR